jgi:uncharacterized protein (TIGR02118 family)
MKLVALYKQPADPNAFDEAYFNTHLPLISKVPGLNKTTITRLMRTYSGEGFYMIAVMEFDNVDALKAGMRSPEMAAAGENLNSFASGLVSLMSGEDTSQDHSAG